MIPNPKPRRCHFLVTQWARNYNRMAYGLNPHNHVATISKDDSDFNRNGVKLAIYDACGRFVESIHCPTYKGLYGVLKTWERS